MEEKEAIAGRQLWRLLPYVKPYKARISVGLLTKGAALTG